MNLRITYFGQKLLNQNLINKYKIVNFDPKLAHLDYLVIFENQNGYQQYHDLFDISNKSIILDDQIETNIIAFIFNKEILIKIDKNSKPTVKSFNNMLIPNILHFVWLSKDGNHDIPEKYRFNINLFKEYNRNFQVIEWNNQKFLDLLQESYPHYYQSFIKIPIHIMKCDIARMIILSKYGGFYFDLDFYCKKSLINLAGQRKIILTKEIPEHCNKKVEQLYNGALACCPGDQFITGWVNRMFENIRKLVVPVTHNVLQTTGPIGFWNYYLDVENKPELISPKYLIPYSNQHKLSEVVDNPNDIYTYTIWNEGTNWASDPSSYSYIILFVVIVILIILVYWYLKKNNN